MIRKHSSLKRAEKVLSHLKSNKDLKLDPRIFLQCYQNGREQGYQITDLIKSFYFSEHRSSDQIVIYEGTYSMQSLSDDAYKNSKCFKTEKEAADYLFKRLTEVF